MSLRTYIFNFTKTLFACVNNTELITHQKIRTLLSHIRLNVKSNQQALPQRLSHDVFTYCQAVGDPVLLCGGLFLFPVRKTRWEGWEENKRQWNTRLKIEARLKKNNRVQTEKVAQRNGTVESHSNRITIKSLANCQQHNGWNTECKNSVPNSQNTAGHVSRYRWKDNSKRNHTVHSSSTQIEVILDSKGDV